MSQRARVLLSSVGMLLTAAIWGFAFVVVKDTVDVIPPVYMMALRFTIAAVGLGVILMRRLSAVTGSMLVQGGLIGVCLFVAYLLQTIGIQYTSAGKNAFLTTVYVILVPLILWIWHRRFPGAHIILASLVALLGIALLTLQDDFGMGRGDVLTLLCGIFFALQIVLIARFTATQDPALLAMLQLAVAAILSWLVAPVLEGSLPLGQLAEVSTMLSILYLGVFSTLVAFLLQNVCQKYTPTAVAAIFLSLEAFFGVLFSWIFLGERLSFRMLVGCLLLFVAILLAETGRPLFSRRQSRARKG